MASLAPERLLGGRYQLRRPIDRGGMAEVWEAEDTVLARPVAVKVLHAHLAMSESFLERFRREAVAAARLAHPGIVATFDTGVDEGVAFIVMELVRGRSLRDVIAAARLSQHDAVAIAFQVADALEHAHRRGVVHRDIKPANILVCDERGHLGPRVKVTDFGIAKLLAGDDGTGGTGGDLTQAGAIIGTARYLSPEQIEGGEPDARSDLYALGVVLYEMLCGRPPFTAPTDLATAMQQVNEAPEPPRALCPEVDAELEAVVLAALAKRAEDRPPSAAAFAARLAEAGLIDDAVPAINAEDRTPASGVVLHVPGRRPRRVLPVVFVLGLAILVAATAAVLLRGPGGDTTDRDAVQSGATVPIARAASFDPAPGDGSENENRAHLAVDSDPATAWTTSRYSTRLFGNLKRGVGLVVQLGERAALTTLDLRTGHEGWSAQIYVANQVAGDLTGWGAPVATVASGSTQEQIDLGERRGAVVLIWVTDLGANRQFELNEVRVTGS